MITEVAVKNRFRGEKARLSIFRMLLYAKPFSLDNLSIKADTENSKLLPFLSIVHGSEESDWTVFRFIKSNFSFENQTNLVCNQKSQNGFLIVL